MNPLEADGVAEREPLVPVYDDLIVIDYFVKYDLRVCSYALAIRRAMPKSPLPRAAKLPANDTHAEREPRGQRRKRETRARLLEAALRLMAVKGMEGVAINQITEAADVGFGSFYNHFESKEAIYDALLHWVFEEFRNIRRDIADPAEVISVSVRHTPAQSSTRPRLGAVPRSRVVLVKGVRT